MYAWQETIVDNAGNTLANSFVEVRDAFTLALATIYGDREGVEVLENPFRTRAGFAQFWADRGRYQITAIQGDDERVWADVRLGFQLGDIPDLTPVLEEAVQGILNPILANVEAQAAAFPDVASFHVLSTGVAGGNIPNGWTATRLGTGHYRVSFPLGFSTYAVKLTAWDNTTGDGRVWAAMLLTKTATSFTWQVDSIGDEASNGTDQRTEVEVTYNAEEGQTAQFIAIAGTAGASNIMTSPDGITWTLRTNPVTLGVFNCLAYSPSLNRVVSVPASGSTTPIYSDDLGVTWQSGTPVTGIDADDVAWSPQAAAFVCNTTGGSNGAHRSTNGISWGSAINTVYSASPTCVTWASDVLGGIFLMGYLTLSNFVRSATGATWVSHTTGAALADVSLRCLIRVPEHGLFLGVNRTNQRLFTSPDGVTWTQRADFAGGTGGGLAYSPELDVAVYVGQGGEIWRSGVGDLTTWGLQASGLGTLTSVCWSSVAGLFVATRSSGTGQRVLTSPDGVTWTARNTPSDITWAKVIVIDPA